MTDHERVEASDAGVEPISGEEARAILTAAITERLGPHWDDEETGWTLVSGHDFMARLTKGRRNIDFYVDLVGNVTVEESEINPGQEAGATFARAFLIGAALVALLLARLAGYF